MSEFLARKHLGKLEPVDEAGQEAMRNLRHGETIKITISRPRNVQHHRKFFALCSIVHANQEHYSSVEQVVAALKVATGHCDFVVTQKGWTAIPRSISFAKMDQTEFNAFYEKCVDYVVTKIIPGISRDDLRNELLEIAA